MQGLVFRMNILQQVILKNWQSQRIQPVLGLILKGYDDYEHNRKQFEKEFKKVDVPDGLKKAMNGGEELVEETVGEESMKKRRNLNRLLGQIQRQDY